MDFCGMSGHDGEVQGGGSGGRELSVARVGG